MSTLIDALYIIKNRSKMPRLQKIKEGPLDFWCVVAGEGGGEGANSNII